MIKINADYLDIQLKHSLNLCYILFGSDPLLLQESIKSIRDQASKQHFKEHLIIKLNNNTDWNSIFSLFQVRNLFKVRQTLLIIFSEISTQTYIKKNT